MAGVMFCESDFAGPLQRGFARFSGFPSWSVGQAYKPCPTTPHRPLGGRTDCQRRQPLVRNTTLELRAAAARR